MLTSWNMLSETNTSLRCFRAQTNLQGRIWSSTSETKGGKRKNANCLSVLHWVLWAGSLTTWIRRKEMLWVFAAKNQTTVISFHVFTIEYWFPFSKSGKKRRNPNKISHFAVSALPLARKDETETRSSSLETWLQKRCRNKMKRATTNHHLLSNFSEFTACFPGGEEETRHNLPRWLRQRNQLQQRRQKRSTRARTEEDIQITGGREQQQNRDLEFLEN